MCVRQVRVRACGLDMRKERQGRTSHVMDCWRILMTILIFAVRADVDMISSSVQNVWLREWSKNSDWETST